MAARGAEGTKNPWPWPSPSRSRILRFMTMSFGPLFFLLLLLLWAPGISVVESAQCVPANGCSWALAYYDLRQGDQLSDLVTRFGTTLKEVQVYNDIPDVDSVEAGQDVLFPFPCECQADSQTLGHNFDYTVALDDTFESIANTKFEGLTTPYLIEKASNLDEDDMIYNGQNVKVPVNCSCGNPTVSSTYGLFITYTTETTDNAASLASKFSVNQNLLEKYNPGVAWGNGRNLSNGDIVFVPSKVVSTGETPPFNFSSNSVASGKGGKSKAGLAIGLSVGAAVVFGLVVGALLCLFLRRHRAKRAPHSGAHHGLEVPVSGQGFSGERKSGPGLNMKQGSSNEGLLDFSRNSPGGGSGGTASPLTKFTVDKSVEYSFEELAAGTNNFNIANKIGEGGYGSVYLANLRGQRLAVKRMNLQATREFLAEIQVLTHVHHTNLVQLIGYCTVDSLFLIYEYVDNGTLDRHLHRTNDIPTLSWVARVQIALDAARGLEYIHEHTKPAYIHRDVKSSNILIDKQFRGKVADFGLTKLTESGIANRSLTVPTRLVGTFGYMSPEYARFGDVSTKVDVYSFGVVLFEIISAKDAIVRPAPVSSTTSGSAPQGGEQRGLVTLFDEVLQNPNGRERLQKLVDPALGTNYPLESAWKVAQLAGACTAENPELRPNMRNVVVALMTLSSTSLDWEMTDFGSDPVMGGFVSGR